jgi:hypothetical protein
MAIEQLDEKTSLDLRDGEQIFYKNCPKFYHQKKTGNVQYNIVITNERIVLVPYKEKKETIEIHYEDIAYLTPSFVEIESSPYLDVQSKQGLTFNIVMKSEGAFKRHFFPKYKFFIPAKFGEGLVNLGKNIKSVLKGEGIKDTMPTYIAARNTIIELIATKMDEYKRSKAGSEAVYLENQTIEKLDLIRKDLFELIIPACIGWAIFNLSAISPIFFMFGMPLAMILMPWSCYRPAFQFGLSVFKFNTFNYNVITTYSDGSKSSDMGAEAFSANMFLMIFKVLFTIVLAFALAVFKIAYGCFTYIITYRSLENKKSIVKTAFPIIIIGFAVLIGAPVASIIIMNASEAIISASELPAGELSTNENEVIQE